MRANTSSHEQRLSRALCALEGLSVGDAFGERFFRHRRALERMWLGQDERVSAHDLDPGLAPWPWTDDTAMAISIVVTLDERPRRKTPYPSSCG